MNKQTKRYAELDALRGIAALMVVFFHFSMGRSEAAYGFKLGITGVDLFFIISGFVITMSISRANKGIDFVISRASRLYPAYWAATTFTFLLIAARAFVAFGDLRGVSLSQYFVNLTMFQFYFMVPDIDGPYWSLIVEMVFYISILLLLHFKQLKRINTIAVCLIAVTVLAQLFFWSYKLKVFLHVTVLLKYLPLFLAGINFYKIHAEKKKPLANYAVIAFCFASQLLLFTNCARAERFMSFTEYSVTLGVIFSVFVLFVNGKLSFIVSRPTLFLGRISYPLYLTHQFLSLCILFPVLIKTWHLNFWMAAFGITLPVDIAVATLITVYVDEPYSKKMKEWLHSLQIRRAGRLPDKSFSDATGKTFGIKQALPEKVAAFIQS